MSQSNQSNLATLAIAEHRLKKEDLDAQRQVRRQRRFNQFTIGLTLFLVGIGTGYGWRMYHERLEARKNTIVLEVIQPATLPAIAYDATRVRPHKQARKYLTGGTNSWLDNEIHQAVLTATGCSKMNTHKED